MRHKKGYRKNTKNRSKFGQKFIFLHRNFVREFPAQTFCNCQILRETSEVKVFHYISQILRKHQKHEINFLFSTGTLSCAVYTHANQGSETNFHQNCQIHVEIQLYFDLVLVKMTKIAHFYLKFELYRLQNNLLRGFMRVPHSLYFVIDYLWPKNISPMFQYSLVLFNHEFKGFQVMILLDQ